MKDESLANVVLIRSMVRCATRSSVSSQLVSNATKSLTSAGYPPAAAMSLMYCQLAMTAVSTLGSLYSMRLIAVGQELYGTGLKMLLNTPVLLSQAPVRMVDHDGPESVVWPTKLVVPVTPWSIRMRNPLVGSS